MDFINKSDFSSVGGKNNLPSQQKADFDFEEFNTAAVTKMK